MRFPKWSLCVRFFCLVLYLPLLSNAGRHLAAQAQKLINIHKQFLWHYASAFNPKNGTSRGKGFQQSLPNVQDIYG